MSNNFNHTAPIHVQFALESIIGSEREIRFLIETGEDASTIHRYASDVRSKMEQVNRYNRKSFSAKALSRARESAKQVALLVKDL